MSGKPNALKHGATSKIVLLWGEKEKDYDTLRAGLYQEWYPDGPTEENLVQQMLYWLWRRQRLDRHEEIAAQEKLRTIRHNNMVCDFIDALRVYAPDFEKANTKEQVEDLLSTLPPDYGNFIRQKWPLAENEDPTKWGTRIAKGMASWNVKRHDGPAEFLALSDPNGLEVTIYRREGIDAKVEQIIKRLVQLKAMKQTQRRLEPKLINGTTAKPTENLFE